MPEKIVSASTVGQGVRYSGGVGSDFIARDVSKEMVKVQAYKTPLLNLLFLSKRAKWRQTANLNGLVEFPEKEMVPNMDTLTAVGSGGSATITITPSQPNLFVEGKSVKMLETNETGYVTTAGATPIITRDPDSDGNARTWTAPSVNSKVLIMGESMTEDDPTPEAVYMDPYMRKSRVQLFEKSIKMTDMMIAATMNGGTYGGNWWDEENRDKVAEQKRDAEIAMWFNENHFITKTANKVRTKTEGLIYQIENNGGQVVPVGSTLDKADWKEFVRSLKIGDSVYKTVFCGDNVMNSLEDIIEDKYTFQQPIKRYGPIAGEDAINVFQYKTGGVIVDLIRCPLWEDKYENYAVAIDDSFLYGLYFAPDKKGPRRFRVEVGVEANGTPREEVKLLAHIGVGIGNCPSCGVLKP